MRYGILGPVQVTAGDGGAAVPVRGARLRALLTALALRAGHEVTVATLAASVWGDAEDGALPQDAPAAVQALVGRLRRTIGADAVRSGPTGYRLAARWETDVDAGRFERLAAEGAELLADGDPGRAAPLLRQALDLWRGQALADLPDGAAAGARLEARRSTALEQRISADLRVDGPSAVLPELRELVAAEPLHEPFRALLVRALAADGRRAEALAAYEEARAEVSERLGVDPGPELRGLHAALLAEDRGAGTAGADTGGGGARGGAGAPGAARGAGAAPAGRPADAGDADGPAAGGSRAGRSPAGGGSDRERSARPRPTGADGPDGPVGGAGASPAGPRPPDAGEPPRWPVGRPTAPGDRPGAPGGPAGPGAATPRGAPGTSGGPAAPAPRAEPAKPRLRLRLSSFVGRGPELRHVGDRLTTDRLVTLTGPGGAGKTRLAEEAADLHATADRFPGGVHLAELAPVEDPATLPAAVLNAVGQRETVLRATATTTLAEQLPTEPAESLPRLLDYLADRRLLLILDNCEHLIADAARFAESLLAACPGLTVLATSREPLNVPGESVLPVEALPQPDALRLFTERAAAVRPGFALTAATRPPVEEICRRLDGLPLAIELAAARLRILSPAQIAARLDDRFRLLTSGARTVLPRQQTLRAVVDWSWELLEPSEQRLLARLSVFVGGFTLESASAVAGGDVLDELAALVDKSLVAAVPGDDPAPRHRLLETIREYAADRLREAEHSAGAVRDAHARYFQTLVDGSATELRSERQLAAMRTLEAEHDNIRAALRHLIDTGRLDSALELANGMAWLWTVRSYGDEAALWLTEILQRCGWGPPEGFRTAEPLRAADLSSWLPAESGEPLPFALDVDDPGDRMRMDAVLHLLMAGQDSDRLEPWRRWLMRVAGRIVDVAVATDYGTAFPGMMFVPMSMFLRGRIAEVSESLRTQIARCRAAGRSWETAMLLTLRARVPAGEDAPEEVRSDPEADAAEAMAVFTEMGDRFGLVQAHSVMAEAYLNGRSRVSRSGSTPPTGVDPARAREHLSEAMRLSAVLEARGELPGLLMQLATAWNLEDRPDEVERCLTEALELCEELGIRDMATMVRVTLAEAARRTGGRDRAWELYRQADRGKDLGTPPPFFDGWVMSLHGRLLSDEGRHREALAEHRKALEALDVPWLDAAPAWQAGIATLATLRGLGEHREAARLLGAATAWRVDFPANPEDEREIHREREALRAELGDAVLEAESARGGKLDREGALALIDAVARRAGAPDEGSG